MKKVIYLATALTVLAAVASCEKNSEISQTRSSGELRQVTIKAGSYQTKTHVENGTLKWSDNDKLYIVPQSGTVAAAALDIDLGAGSAEGTFKGLIDASITDVTDLYGWCGGSWTYNEGTFSVDMPAEQTYVPNGLDENAYPSIGIGTITDGITLSNPMGVLKLSVKGATAGDKVKSITVTSAANNLAGAFTVNPASSYAVSGGSSKTVILNVADPYAALSLTDSVNFYIVIPPAEYASNDLTVKITFSDDSYLNSTLTEAVTVTANNATAIKTDDHTGRRGTLNGQDFVIIKGSDGKYLKWATQNLAVTTSGQAKWKTTDYQIGDYFQWAASYGGYGLDGTTGKEKVITNLVIYTSFTNNDTSHSFSGWKKSKRFLKAFAPYGGTSYNNYTSYPAKLALTDDVANIVLGSTWRMPTGGSSGEFKAMKDATKWSWNNADKGYYVTKSGEKLSSDKSNALLFFPAAGYGNNDVLYSNPSDPAGYYWSSTLSNATDNARDLSFVPTNVNPEHFTVRYSGFSVRPVSD